ncbi:MAG: hypothetical protein KKD74_03315 [Bacteroidetes bacterium]|nr:hypothetical protein [Bacteroidota bacterium]
MYFNKFKLFSLAFLLISCSLQAQVYEKSKHFSEHFPVSKNTEINITNKYGNVHLVSWEKDSVRFEVDLKVSSSKQQKVDKAFNDIDVRFTSTPNFVNASTVFANAGNIWSELSDMTKTVINTGNLAEINYTVYLPSDLRVTVDNRFGNVYTTDHSAATSFTVSNGNLQANYLAEKSTVVVEFGNANINRVDLGRIELNYAEIEVKQAGQLTLTGRSSTIHLGSVEALQLDSRRDRIQVDEAISVTGESSFSRLTFNRLKTSFLLKATYGTLTLGDFSPTFKTLQLNSDYAVNNIYVNSNHFTAIEVNYRARTKVNLPVEIKVLEKQEPAPGKDDGFLKAAIGTGLMGSFRFNTSGGEVNIFYKP